MSAVTQEQTCQGLIVLSRISTVGYVEGVPSAGVPGKMHPATDLEVAAALRHCGEMAHGLAELQTWALDAMRCLKEDKVGKPGT